MEQESFEDPQVARLMNSAFVNIKVDREERPDIDAVYMKASQALTGRGGWPLNLVLTPEQRPFFATTYIPKDPGFGGSGMLDLIPRLSQLWTEQRDHVEYLASQVSLAIEEQPIRDATAELNKELLEAGYAQLLARFDKQHGGFGGAPKFPTPHNLTFLLRYWKRNKADKALAMVEQTLEAMRRGGIFDHLGFGFHRYATDAEWLVPHFEKMLYDQALLALAYTETYQATKAIQYQRTADEIFTYVLRDMTSPQGGFFTAEDADSEGEEGKFYLWRMEELEDVLDADQYKIITGFLDLNKDGNFTADASATRTGANIIYQQRRLSEFARAQRRSVEEMQSLWDGIRELLLAERNKRVHPLKDTKILTDWNGLMIAALARAGAVFDAPQYTKAAEKAADFLLSNLLSPESTLFHRYCDGEVAIHGFLNDYAFLIWAQIELYEATFATRFLQNAVQLSEDMIRGFWDGEQGGFNFTHQDAEQLPARLKDADDGAVPSGNSVAMLDLLRLGHLTGNTFFLGKALQTGNTFAPMMELSPLAFTQMLGAVDLAIGPSYEVVITGDGNGNQLREMLKSLRQVFAPRVDVLLLSKAHSSKVVKLAPYTAGLTSQKDRITAHVCSNFDCETSTNSAEELQNALEDRGN